MVAAPAVVMKLGGMEAVTWVALTTVVASCRPFQRTCAPAQLVPLRVRTSEEDPEVAEAGASEVMVGGGGLMTKVRAFEAAPAEFETVMAAEPCAWIRDAGTLAVN